MRTSVGNALNRDGIVPSRGHIGRVQKMGKDIVVIGAILVFITVFVPVSEILSSSVAPVPLTMEDLGQVIAGESCSTHSNCKESERWGAKVSLSWSGTKYEDSNAKYQFHSPSDGSGTRTQSGSTEKVDLDNPTNPCDTSPSGVWIPVTGGTESGSSDSTTRYTCVVTC